jgi:hypothetical protein
MRIALALVVATFATICLCAITGASYLFLRGAAGDASLTSATTVPVSPVSPPLPATTPPGPARGGTPIPTLVTPR